MLECDSSILFLLLTMDGSGASTFRFELYAGA